MGTPRIYCDCSVCKEARTTGNNVRLRSSLLLEEPGQQPLLLDCGPDWRLQMECLNIRNVSQGLITHAHIDHIGGLPDWADACRWTDSIAQLYAPQEVLGEIRSRFPWAERHLMMNENDNGSEYGDWFITPWRVNHGKNGYSYAYHFENRKTLVRWAYCSDSINLTDQQKAPLSGLTLLVLGTSFVDEPYPLESRSVYDMKEGILLAEETKPVSVLFTHMSHDIDMNGNYELPPNIKLARTGMSVTL